MCVCVLVAQWCRLCNPMDGSPPGSSVHGIFQARILEWVAIPFSRGSSQARDQTHVSCAAGRFFTIWATREALKKGQHCIITKLLKLCVHWKLFLFFPLWKLSLIVIIKMSTLHLDRIRMTDVIEFSREIQIGTIYYIIYPIVISG